MQLTKKYYLYNIKQQQNNKKMAYITTKEVAAIRTQLKEAFGKEYKFSVKRQNMSCVDVSLMKSKFDIDFGTEDANKYQYQQMNHHCLDTYEMQPELVEVLKKVTAISMEGNFDKSDSQTDYFHVGWYFHLSIGQWDKPYIQTK